MLGWLSAEVVRASRWKRSVASGSAVADSGRNFTRDVPAEPQVLGAIDHAHAAGTQPVDDAVVRDNGADHLEPVRAMPGMAFRNGIVVVHFDPVKGTTRSANRTPPPAPGCTFPRVILGPISMTGPPIAMSGQDIVIPDKSAFKASEVCEIAKVQPYVLRSWENEFPELGVSRTPGGPRVYRKADVERVLQIRHLVLAEGLTLAGVRRKLEGAGVTPPAAAVAAERRGPGPPP